MSAILPTEDYSPDLYTVDWIVILRDLHERGVTAYRVAVLMGVNAITVYRWLKLGYEPKMRYGRALLAIHSRYCGEALTTSRTAITSRQHHI